MNAKQSLRIAVIGGDGTGPEVAAEGLKVLKAVAALENFKFELTDFDFGGDRYLRTGETLPAGRGRRAAQVRRHLPRRRRPSRRRARHPRKGPAARAAVSARPVHQPAAREAVSRRRDAAARTKGPTDIDFVVVRENTEDLYCGVGGFLKKDTPDEVATQTALYTRKGCERCIRWAFEFTRKRNNPKKMLTLVAKTNVLTFGHDLWWRTFQEVGQGISRHQGRLQPRRRLLHVDGEEPRVLRRDRDHQHVRRHHHRPGRHHPGRHGRRRRRQHQPRPGRRQHVRADGRQRPEVHRHRT